MTEKPGILAYRSGVAADRNDGWIALTDRRYPAAIVAVVGLLIAVFGGSYLRSLSLALSLWFVLVLAGIWYVYAACARRFAGRPLLGAQSFFASMGVLLYARDVISRVGQAPRANWALYWWWLRNDRDRPLEAAAVALGLCLAWLFAIFCYDALTRRRQESSNISTHDPHPH